MPAYLKLILSILVAIVAAVVHWTQAEAGQGFNSWLVLGLAAFMILAVWLFPEPRRRTGKDGR
jgi:hypothetical protein